MEHEMRVEKAVYAAIVEPLAMLSTALFDGWVEVDDIVHVICTDDDSYSPVRMKVTGIAAVCERLP